jgi:hypothetical protein
LATWHFFVLSKTAVAVAVVVAVVVAGVVAGVVAVLVAVEEVAVGLMPELLVFPLPQCQKLMSALLSL